VPNWYTYWTQTSAAEHPYEPDRYDATLWGENQYGATEFFGGHWVRMIGPHANGTGMYQQEWDGIDTFADICRHEWEHDKDYTEWWGNNPPDPAHDFDGDMIPDEVEQGPLGAAWGFSWRNDHSHGPAEKRDDEYYCVAMQPQWTQHAADAEDWAKPSSTHWSHSLTGGGPPLP
jgi:hypothetical protein